MRSSAVMNAYIVRELIERLLHLLEPVDDILDGGRDEEVLLLQTKLLTGVSVIVRV
jgi:hypothetical protein